MAITAPKAPPRKSGSSTGGGSKNTIALMGKAKERSEGLQGWAQIGSLVCISKGWFADAGAIGMHAPGLCDEAARLADDNEQVARVLDYLAMSGPYAALMGAALPLVMQLLVNHGKMPVPAGVAGVMAPAALESQVKAEMMTMQAEMLKAEAQAKKALADAEAEIAAVGE